MQKWPLISICIPVFNEVNNIEPFWFRLRAVLENLHSSYTFEIIFSDNHSTDNTWDALTKIASTDPRIRLIRFTRNVGAQSSLLANYMHAQGSAVFQLDVDLQDPPELLPEFLVKWGEGFDVVYGVRRGRKESMFINTFRKIGYAIIDKLSDNGIPRNVGDFRLIDRKVVTRLSNNAGYRPYLRGAIASFGYRETGIIYDREERTADKSKFGLLKLLKLGMDGIFNYSVVPLRLASYFGGFILLSDFLLGLFYLLARVTHSNLPQGFTTLALLVLTGIGINTLFLGIIGEYLIRIYFLLQPRAIAVVEISHNIEMKEL